MKQEESIQVILHIGLHKTGTTFLQRNVFSQFSDIDYIHATYSFKSLIGSHDKLLISNEGFSGNAYTNISKRKTYQEQFKTNISYLKRLFPNCKIIFGVREPSSLINSLYKQHLQEGGTLSFDQFFNLENSGLIKTNELKIEEFIMFLNREFHQSDLLIYNYESIKPGKMTELLDKITTFIDTDTTFLKFENLNKKRNISTPDNLEKLLRFLNKVDFRFQKFGLTLNNKLFDKLYITPRKLCQNVLPRIVSNKKKRNLNGIKEYYSMSWGVVMDMIN